MSNREEQLAHVLKRILHELPRNKDWLDPMLEKQGQDLLKEDDSKIEKYIWSTIQKMLEFPCPTICRHNVAASLLSILEEHGEPVTRELADAVVTAEDERALLEMKKLGKLKS